MEHCMGVVLLDSVVGHCHSSLCMTGFLDNCVGVYAQLLAIGHNFVDHPA